MLDDQDADSVKQMIWHYYAANQEKNYKMELELQLLKKDKVMIGFDFILVSL